VNSAVRVEETEFDGAPALELAAGPLRAVVLPDVGMTGVSLRRGDDEFLALPDGVSGLRAGRTGGLPLLAPWANRLSSLRFTAADVDVDLAKKVVFPIYLKLGKIMK
jgi:galactose mutarotase-like enzyme